MAGPRAAILAVAALLAPALAGCLDPFRAHVDEEALRRATLDWARRDHPQSEGGGLFDVKTAQTEYTHSGGSPPPFPAHLVVFSLRAVGPPPTDELLRLTRIAVDNETARQGIRIDARQSTTGQRTLANGLQTAFFTETGTTTSGGLFALNTKVRIVGEVGYDGRSSTSIVVVGMAQVESSRSCPLGINCGTTHNEVNWIEMVGDPHGSVGGATSPSGLIHHLVTHG